MSIGVIIFSILLVALIVLYIVVMKKKWIGSASGIFTSQVIMHDLVPKDKQKAMEYIIENQEDQHRRKGDFGEGTEGGDYINEE